MHNNQPIQPGSLVLPKSASNTNEGGQGGALPVITPTPQLAVIASNTPTVDGQSMVKLRGQAGLSMDSTSAETGGLDFSDTKVVDPAILAQPAPAPYTQGAYYDSGQVVPAYSAPPTQAQPGVLVSVPAVVGQADIVNQPNLQPTQAEYQYYQAPPMAPSSTPISQSQVSVASPLLVASAPPLPLAPVPQPALQVVPPSPINSPPMAIPPTSPVAPSVPIPQPNAPAPTTAPNPQPTQPVSSAPTSPAQPNSQKDWLVYAALAIGIISILAQVFVSGTPGFAIILVGISLVGIFLGFKSLKGGKRSIAVAVVIISALALVSAVVQAGIAINIARKCQTDPSYAAQSAQCQR